MEAKEILNNFHFYILFLTIFSVYWKIFDLQQLLPGL